MMDAKFFRARAEYWHADEKVRQKKGKDRKSPSPAPPGDK
jgi:hypothetical protein